MLSKEFMTEGKVIEANIGNEASSLRERERQLVSFAQQCPCAFCHDSEVRAGELQHSSH
jgi:hypothetical protein